MEFKPTIPQYLCKLDGRLTDSKVLTHWYKTFENNQRLALGHQQRLAVWNSLVSPWPSWKKDIDCSWIMGPWISWWCSWLPEATHHPTCHHDQVHPRSICSTSQGLHCPLPQRRPLCSRGCGLWGTSKGSFIWFPLIVSLLHSVSTRFLVPLNRQPSSACHADYASTDLGRWRQAGNESTNANKWGKKTVRMCNIWKNRHSDSWNSVISHIYSERGTMALYALKCWHSLNALISWNARISNSVSGSAEQLVLQPVGKRERKEQLN